MAVDMFMNIDTIKGESADATYKGEIDVLAWSWGASNSGTAHVGGGAGAGKVNVQDLSFTKWIDLSSPELFLATCSGKHFPKATLTVRKAGGEQMPYVVITMEDVLITSLSTGGSGGEDRLTENVTLNFGKVTVQYTQQTETGGKGEQPQTGWNIKENVKV